QQQRFSPFGWNQYGLVAIDRPCKSAVHYSSFNQRLKIAMRTGRVGHQQFKTAVVHAVKETHGVEREQPPQLKGRSLENPLTILGATEIALKFTAGGQHFQDQHESLVGLLKIADPLLKEFR